MRQLSTHAIETSRYFLTGLPNIAWHKDWKVQPMGDAEVESSARYDCELVQIIHAR